MKMVSSLALVATLMLSGLAVADDCILQITRTACPGKETESYAKCGGKPSCDEAKPAASAALCASKAKEACSNSRADVTKYKKVTALFGGKPVEDGKDFCAGHPDYPYTKQADCKG